MANGRWSDRGSPSGTDLPDPKRRQSQVSIPVNPTVAGRSPLNASSRATMPQITTSGARAPVSEVSAPIAAPRPLESIQYLGRLADKMFAMGRIDAAVKILANPMTDILTAARGGQPIEPEEVDAIGRYAMRLANETLDTRWVDTAMEIHLLSCRPMRAETVRQLAVLRGKAPLGNTVLLVRYHEKLRSHMAEMNAEERALCVRVGELL
jgi:hypothetical protein